MQLEQTDINISFPASSSWLHVLIIQQKVIFWGGGTLGQIDFLVHLALTGLVNPIHSNSDSGKFVLFISVSLSVVL